MVDREPIEKHVDLFAIEQGFRRGKEVIAPWIGDEQERVRNGLATLDGYLAQLPLNNSFGGVDNRDVVRQTFWLASRGIGSPFDTDPKVLEKLDGNFEDGLDGLKALQNPAVGNAVLGIKSVLDRSLLLAAKAVDLPMRGLTARYRFIRYEGTETDAGIGPHPDGNAISALLTNEKGLFVFNSDGKAVYEPPFDKGVILMGGTTLRDWSFDVYGAPVHAVKVPKGNPPKVSVATFLNFPDKTEIPRSNKLGHNTRPPYDHDVKARKKADMKETDSTWKRIDLRNLPI